MSDSQKHVSYAPTAGLSYDPGEPKYWDAQGLDGEVTRAFEICNGCRMCFKYCDSFPILFGMMDGPYQMDARRLGPPDVERVMDACFQCKLCEVQCPYTPRDKHEFMLDFPKLVHRWRAVHGRSKRKTLRQRLLGDPDTAGRMARLSLGMANLVNRLA
ncbi:MAG TPA: 4Fe-4S dicluster domain-containing protein, partial [Anaeromyxobacteraceae bacterium]